MKKQLNINFNHLFKLMLKYKHEPMLGLSLGRICVRSCSKATGLGVGLIILVMLNFGCAKKKSSDLIPPPATTPVPTLPGGGTGPTLPGGTGPGGANGSTAGVELKIVNIPRLSDFAGRTFTANVTNIRLEINVAKFGNGFGGSIGSVIISYTDQGEDAGGEFGSGNSDQTNKYNTWADRNGDGIKDWHGFFEDHYCFNDPVNGPVCYAGGAIVVVIDGVESDNGTGETSTSKKVQGSVWYKNSPIQGFFRVLSPTTWVGPSGVVSAHPPTNCWFVSIGPWDCRAWRSGNGVSTNQAVNPDNGYQKLGTFSGLDVDEAFNGEAPL